MRSCAQGHTVRADPHPWVGAGSSTAPNSRQEQKWRIESLKPPSLPGHHADVWGCRFRPGAYSQQERAVCTGLSDPTEWSGFRKTERKAPVCGEGWQPEVWEPPDGGAGREVVWGWLYQGAEVNEGWGRGGAESNTLVNHGETFYFACIISIHTSGKSR